MNQYYKSSVLNFEDSIEFSRELAQIIKEYQDRGLTVEVQYSTTQRLWKPVYTALVLGMKK